MAAAALIVIAASAAWLIYDSSRSHPSVPATDLICDECRYEYSETNPRLYDAGYALQPLKCPKCGKKAVYVALECLDCKTRFAQKVLGPPFETVKGPAPSCPGVSVPLAICKERGLKYEAPVCPKCKSVKVALPKRSQV